MLKLFALIWVFLGLLSVTPIPGRKLKLYLWQTILIGVLCGPFIFVYACYLGWTKRNDAPDS